VIVTPHVILTAYPQGVQNESEPSGMSPPAASALPGFRLAYINDFKGSAIPPGWDVFTGVPGGDPGGQFSPGHVAVKGGMLQFSTWPDPAYGGAWVTGGICQCGLARTYGAYFVRTRVTGPGPTAVELLWPATNQWPPEIDFSETTGGVTASLATIHYGSSNHEDQRELAVRMTTWHTFGVVWTPGQVIYLVDGKVWGTVSRPTEIPSLAMTLDLQQQTWCLSSWACPSNVQTMQVDWVAEYQLTGPLSVTVGPFQNDGFSLTSALDDEVSSLAYDVADMHCKSVTVLGYANPSSTVSQEHADSLRRATVVRNRLSADLVALKVRGVAITAKGLGIADPVGSIKTVAGRAQNPRAVGTVCAPT